MKRTKSAPKQPSSPSAAELNALLVLYNGRRYAEAESCTRSMLGQYPEFGFGWKLLGSTLQMQGKDALSALQKAAVLMPGDAEAHFNLGNTLKGLGQYKEAITSYRRALKIKPDFAEVHSNLGFASKQLGQLDDAIASCRRNLRRPPL